MANPVVVPCAKDVWTKVATNVISGQIWRLSSKPKYYHTYRDTGGDAPEDLTEAVPIFVDGNIDREEIAAVSGIDIYIYCRRSAGSVRVDLP